MTSVATGLPRRARERLGPEHATEFLARLTRILPDATRTLDALYGSRTDAQALLHTLVDDALDHAAARDPALRRLDEARESDPGWFQDARMIGYVCYADRFAGTLTGVGEHLDHLAELGVTYLHLMPLLQPRAGESDGGYAVADYDTVDPRLGTTADLTALADKLHSRGMVLCIDMVLNHTAREHEWAREAAAGEPGKRAFYRIFPDRTEPDAFEQTLPEIFPALAPGNFTYDVEAGGWVWTTFHDFQWDLDYSNPDVFRAMLATMLRLANRGVDVLRLDAVPFLWKRLGTDCQNQPEAHLLLQAFRAFTRLAAPGLLLKAEAMVEPEILATYLGAQDVYHPECDLAYDNQLMVMLWSAMATGDARLATQALARRPPAPDPAAWVTYVRCHDDIGWAVSDVDALAAGMSGPEHRRWLSEFYTGSTPDSFADGEVFQGHRGGASPVSGTLASLCGVGAALAGEDDAALRLALRRLETMYSVVFSFGGIPLIYMGDELAMLNDRTAVHEDNRWLHRPPMDWVLAAYRHDAGSVPGRAHVALRRLAIARASQPSLGSTAPTTVLDTGEPQLLVYLRGRPRERPVLAVVNMSVAPASMDTATIGSAGITTPVHLHSTTGSLDITAGRLELPGCGFCWLGERPT